MLLIGIGATGGGVLLLFTALVVGAPRRQVSRSLALVNGMRVPVDAAGPASEPFADRVLSPAFAGLGRLARRFTPSQMGLKLAGQLDRAGNPPAWTPDRVYGLKGAGLIGFGLLAALLTRSSPVFVVAVPAFAAAGLFLPNLLIYNMAQKRDIEIQKALPDGLDLLTISVEAGLGFDAALAQVSRNTDGALAGEFFRVLQEMQIGKTRANAFRALADRTGLADLRAFVSALVQADAFGIPISGVLREQAREMRIKRRQRAEERAQKVTVKILFPLIFCILPSLFVIILGPGAISIYQQLIR